MFILFLVDKIGFRICFKFSKIKKVNSKMFNSRNRCRCTLVLCIFGKL